MRFTSYCVGEGVRSVSTHVLWATHSTVGVVTDASITARARGVHPGLSTRAAKAMVPELECILETEELANVMDNVVQIIAAGTPWIERIESDTLYFQLPGKQPPMREVRSILASVDQLLSKEQCIRIGMAETPYLARTLVEWHRVERVPEALYWRVGRQTWLVSPGIAAMIHGKSQHPSLAWLSQLPILAFWRVPIEVRERLVSLGVYRLEGLRTIPQAYLKRQFGLESLEWLEWLNRLPQGSIQINYPRQQSAVQWTSDIGEAAPVSAFHEILAGLAERLERLLLKQSMGALKLSLEWETERGIGCFQRAFKHPVVDKEALFSAVEAERVNGRRLGSVQLIAEDLQVLVAVQQRLPEWLVRSRGSRGMAKEVANLPRLVRHVNRKFPGALQMGIQPTFRELRLQAARSGTTEFSLRLGSAHS